jgi:hypothetical protein
MVFEVIINTPAISETLRVPTSSQDNALPPFVGPSMPDG